jgi:hypothetical protein
MDPATQQFFATQMQLIQNLTAAVLWQPIRDNFVQSPKPLHLVIVL